MDRLDLSPLERAPQPSDSRVWGPPPYRHLPVEPSPLRRSTPRPSPFRVKELAAAIVIVAAVDVSLWATGGLAPGGLGAALLFTVVPAALFASTRAWRGSPRLGVVAVLLAAVAVRCAIDPTSGTVVSGLGLLLVLAMTLRARRTFVPEIAASFFSGIAKFPSRIAAAAIGVRRAATKILPRRLEGASFLPVVVPLALGGIFVGVFALANPVVARGVAFAWSVVTRIVSLPSPSHIVLWVVATIVATSLVRPAIRLARGTETALEGNPATDASVLVARNALALLNAIFFAYNALDAVYLWSGAPPAGTDTQTYAHQGAFWLTIALVMLTTVVGVMFRGALAIDGRATLARRLAYAWMAQGLVLGLGTYRRIAIHVAHSGLSDLRIVGILGTTLVLGGVALVALKLKRRHTFTWLLRRQLDAFAVTAILYSVFPTHTISARVNVSRIASGEYRPLLHMFRESKRTESAGILVPLLEHPDVRVRQGVAALLEDERTDLQHEIASERLWRERDVAGPRTLAALDDAAPRTAEVLGSVDRGAARSVLLEISRVANEDRSLEELLAIPAARDWSGGSSYEGAR